MVSVATGFMTSFSSRELRSEPGQRWSFQVSMLGYTTNSGIRYVLRLIESSMKYRLLETHFGFFKPHTLEVQGLLVVREDNCPRIPEISQV